MTCPIADETCLGGCPTHVKTHDVTQPRRLADQGSGLHTASRAGLYEADRMLHGGAEMNSPTVRLHEIKIFLNPHALKTTNQPCNILLEEWLYIGVANSGRGTLVFA